MQSNYSSQYKIQEDGYACVSPLYNYRKLGNDVPLEVELFSKYHKKKAFYAHLYIV